MTCELKQSLCIEPQQTTSGHYVRPQLCGERKVIRTPAIALRQPASVTPALEEVKLSKVEQIVSFFVLINIRTLNKVAFDIMNKKGRLLRKFVSKIEHAHNL